MVNSAQDFTMSTICSEKEEIKAAYNRLPARKVRAEGNSASQRMHWYQPQTKPRDVSHQSCEVIGKIQEARLKIGKERKWGEAEIKRKK